jgi:hypothetical protein
MPSKRASAFTRASSSMPDRRGMRRSQNSSAGRAPPSSRSQACSPSSASSTSNGPAAALSIMCISIMRDTTSSSTIRTFIG